MAKCARLEENVCEWPSDVTDDIVECEVEEEITVGGES